MSEERREWMGLVAELREKLASAEARNECPECGLAPGATAQRWCAECVGELQAKLAAAEADIALLNQMLRATGYGQGQIDACAAECEEHEKCRRLLREACECEEHGVWMEQRWFDEAASAAGGV